MKTKVIEDYNNTLCRVNGFLGDKCIYSLSLRLNTKRGKDKCQNTNYP